MKVSASVKSSFQQHHVHVQTNDSGKEIKIDCKPSGFGSAVNGAELLLLSLATCYCNDIYREAAKRNIQLSHVEVIFNGQFGADGEPGFDFSYTANVVSGADPAVIEDLIKHTDAIAEIHNTLRKGIDIQLVR